MNHAQVASGDIPDLVIEQDIPPEVDDDEAHARYARAAVAFMVDRFSEQFEDDEVEAAAEIYQEQQVGWRAW